MLMNSDGWHWVQTAAVGVAGFLAKSAWDYVAKQRAAKKSRLTRLHELAALLEESRNIFLSQVYFAGRLLGLIRSNHPNDCQDKWGFDETFFRLYSILNDDEKELHALIRGTTANSMRRVNESLSEWLRTNAMLKRSTGKASLDALADNLCLLELHMNQWHDKYKSIFAPDDRHTIVFL